jgi:hypothetical protein
MTDEKPLPWWEAVAIYKANIQKAKPNHDAVPEAIAYADGEPAPKCGGEAGISSRDGTGNTPTLTAEEREAIFFFAAIDCNDPTLGGYAATLRNLLERLTGTTSGT